MDRKDALALLQKYNHEPFHNFACTYGGRRYEMVC